MLGLDVRREVTHVLDLLELRRACAEVEQDVIDGLFGRNDACVALPDRTAFDDELARIGRIAVGEVVPCGVSRQLGENLEFASAQRLEGLIAGTELRSGARDVGSGRNTLHAGNRELAAGGERRPRKQFALYGPVQVARAFGGNARGIGDRLQLGEGDVHGAVILRLLAADGLFQRSVRIGKLVPREGLLGARLRIQHDGGVVIGRDQRHGSGFGREVEFVTVIVRLGFGRAVHDDRAGDVPQHGDMLEGVVPLIDIARFAH